ncbi:MAG TPA: tryptophan-rich sensory protein [Alphaproteobacteria bacterium]|nr:tryptophan-rich sensory protein [Alphaproteobacteria bacterium]
MKVFKFLLALALSFIPGALGILWTPTSGGSAWYSTLAHPILTPPSWFFGVMWTTLYLLLAVAFYLVIRTAKASREKLLSIELFVTHIILNASWSYVFFGEHLITFGAVMIIALIIVAFMMSQEFGRSHRYARILVIPYIVWLFCALYLNTGIYFLN